MLYTLYIPTQEKTGIVGYWLDENGNVFVDNIETKTFYTPFDFTCIEFEDRIEELFFNGQQAVFWTTNNITAIIQFKDYSVKKLTKRIQYNIKEENFEIMKNFLLRKFGGFTCFEKDGGYTLEIWTN